MHPLIGLKPPPGGDRLQCKKRLKKKVIRNDAGDSCAMTKKLLKRAQLIDHASLEMGASGRRSYLVDNWLASRTNHAQRVILPIIVIHLPVGFGATFTNGNKVGERDRISSQ